MESNFKYNNVKNYTNNKGLYLVISLIIITILIGLSTLLIKFAVSGHNIFVVSKNQLVLSNQSKNATYTIRTNINDFLQELKNNTLQPNIAFVNITPTNTTIEKPINYNNLPNINDTLFTKDNNANKYIKIKSNNTNGLFFINTIKKYTSSTSNDIFYDLKISATICNTANGKDSCDTNNLFVTKQISCPTPANSNGTMRAVQPNELPNDTIYEFPSVYCTCSDPYFSHTNNKGECTHYTPCSAGTYRTNTGCQPCTSQLGVANCKEDGTPTECIAGYGFYNNTCTVCTNGETSAGGTYPCISCPSNMYIYKNTCVSSCPNHTYIFNVNCEICNNPLYLNVPESAGWVQLWKSACDRYGILNNRICLDCFVGNYHCGCIYSEWEDGSINRYISWQTEKNTNCVSLCKDNGAIFFVSGPFC